MASSPSQQQRLLAVREEVRRLEEHEVGKLERLVREARGLVAEGPQWELWCKFLAKEVVPRWDDVRGLAQALEVAPPGKHWQRLDLVCEGLSSSGEFARGSDAPRDLWRLAASRQEDWVVEAAAEIADDATAAALFLDAWTRLPRLAANAVSAASRSSSSSQLPVDFLNDWRAAGCRAVVRNALTAADSAFFAAFATRCKLHSCCDLLAREWTLLSLTTTTTTEDSSSSSSSSRRLFASLRGSAVDGMAEALLRLGADAGDDSRRRWGPFLDATAGTSRSLVKRLACGRCLTALPRAAAYCVRFAARDSALFDEVAAAATALWVDAEFVRTADEDRRYFVSLVVLYALRAARERFPDKKDALVLAVVPGVNTHLDSTRDDDRWAGMVVGEAFAALVGQPLAFDDVPADYRRRALAFLGDVGLEAAPPEAAPSSSAAAENEEKAKLYEQYDVESKIASREAEKKRRRKVRENLRRSKVDNPDDVVLSGSESDDNSEEEEEEEEEDLAEDSDDEESLEAFDLTDPGEDLAAVQRPRYLRDLLDLLATKREKEDARDKHVVALESAEALIRARPHDLRDAAPALAKTVLNLGNNFDLPGFELRCRQSLVSLAALQPREVAAYLVPQFVDAELTVAKRVEILDCLAAAARELAFGLDRAVDVDDARHQDPADRRRDLEKLQASSTNNDGHPPSASSSIYVKGPPVVDLLENGRRVSRRRRHDADAPQQKTRRWGYRRNPAEKTRPNEFGALAPRHFFFPLLYAYLSPAGKKVRVDSSFAGLLLCNLLNTLSVFAHCAATTPAAPALATHLLAFAWAKARDADPAVRRSACVATVTALTSVPNGRLLLQRHAGTLGLPPEHDLHAYAAHAAANDPDPSVRALTTNIARALDPQGTLLL